MYRPAMLPGQRRGDYGLASAWRDKAMNETVEESMSAGNECGKGDMLLIDNTFDNSRGWGDGLLFVPGLPLEIRPAAELGFTAGPGSDASLQVAQGNPTEEYEYAHCNINLKTTHQLCIACKDTFNYYCLFVDEITKWKDDSHAEGDVFPMANNVIHQGSLIPLVGFANGTVPCVICAEIWSKIKSLYPHLDSSLYQDYRIECSWQRHTSAKDEQKMWFTMTDPNDEKDPLWNWQPILQLSMWPKAHFSSHFEAKGNTAAVIPIRGPWDGCADAGTNDSLNTRGLVLGWLDRCMRNTEGLHTLCNRQDRVFLPTRLLDVRQALERANVRLVCPSERPELFASDGSRDYVTLSHCWGAWGAKENPILKIDNLESRKGDGLPWEEIPRTFQDVFKIASWFGWNWLWIDSLCIVQDSKRDWEQEAAMMDKVYQNAQINISADSGEDNRAGCFVHQQQNATTPLEFASKTAAEGWLVTTESAFSWMDSATSLSRAWIYRERQLAPRVLHFTETEVVWECCGRQGSGFASETMPGGAPFDRIFNGETKLQIQWSRARHDANPTEDDESLQSIYRLWNSTCEGLSAKSVTHPQDMPVILSSLAREMHRMIPDDEYAGGLWRSTMPDSLLWWNEGVRLDDVGDVAPSWSWLSVASHVNLAIQNRAQHKIAVAQVTGTDLDLETADPYGRVSRGELRMAGYLRRLHFHFINPGRFIISVIEQDSHGQDRLRLIGPDWNQHDGQVCHLAVDSTLILPYQQLECYAFFSSIAEWAQDFETCSRKISCLLLEPVEGAESTFRRLGVLRNICDAYSFKLRYAVAPEATHADAGVLRSEQQENSIGYTGPRSSAHIGSMGLPIARPLNIWDLLAKLIQHKRWDIIDDFKQNASERMSSNASQEMGCLAETSEPEDGMGDGEDIHQEEESVISHSQATNGGMPVSKDRDLAHTYIDAVPALEIDGAVRVRSSHEVCTKIIRQVMRHTSSDTHSVPISKSRAQAVDELAIIESATEAYGSQVAPIEALYQFDDVVDALQRGLQMVPWLKRLDVVDVILV
ncbi:unnamed protein product [Clonostachys rosea]|uniref:Heterokaryon incompatibility domain-containing protein n=1 Tax=Bionectria ochroleuca TaxID=29856 RepID=A0ABY6UJG8_BIOOC|nr:unnamed protein product [Clonostachys rosea]